MAAINEQTIYAILFVGTQGVVTPAVAFVRKEDAVSMWQSLQFGIGNPIECDPFNKGACADQGRKSICYYIASVTLIS